MIAPLRRLALTCLIGAVLAGCAGREPPDIACAEMRLAAGTGILPPAPASSLPTERDAVAGMAEMFSQRAVRRARRVNVALLSSGGQWGAFSAGFMTGWSQNAADPRPARFDVVTGVSTGALMAPFVFAGPDYDPVLRELYDGIDEDRILRRRPAFELIGSPSVWDPSPLEAEVAARLTPDFLDEIASASDSRSLLVGAVNLQSGFFEAFDLTSMAASASPQRADCLAEGLLASAAIPVAFPPRRIGGDLYIDGAARQGLFLEGLARADVRPEVYVFLNSAVGFPSDAPEYRLTSLVGRTSSIVTDELLRQSAIEAVLFAKARGWRVRGVAAPDIWPGPECDLPRGGGQRAFCAPFTKQLFQAGYDLAANGPIDWLNADQLIAEMRRQAAAVRGEAG